MTSQERSKRCLTQLDPQLCFIKDKSNALESGFLERIATEEEAGGSTCVIGMRLT